MAEDEGQTTTAGSFPKRHQRYLMMYVVAVVFFVLTASLYNYSILFVSFQEEFHTSAAFTGWAGALACAIHGCTGPISALLIHRFGPRIMTLVGAVIFSAGLAATSFVPAFIYVYLTFGVMVGFGASFMSQAGFTLIIDWFPGKSCSRSISLVLLGTSLSILAIAPLLNALISAYGWRSALRIVSGGSLIIAFVHGLFFVEPAHFQPPDSSSYEMVKTNEVGASDDRQPHKNDRLQHNTETLGHRGAKLCRQVDAWLWLFAVTLEFVGWTFSNVNFASFMEGDLGFTSDQVSLTFVLLSVGETLGKILMAFAFSGLPFRKVYVVAAASFLSAGVAGLMTVLQTVPLMYTVATFAGLIRSASYVMPYPAAQELFGNYGSDIVTMLGAMPYGIGVLIGAPLSGGLYDLTGDYVLSLLVIVALFTCSAGLLLVIPVRQRLRLWRTRRREGAVVS